MSRLAFVDVEFHRKTRSSAFFVEVLEKKFVVDRYWQSTWRSQPEDSRIQEISGRQYDAIVLWQAMYPPSALTRLNCPNITLIPMYDSVVGKDKGFWESYRGFKFLCFSRNLHNRLRDLNLCSLYLQYAPASRRRSIEGHCFENLTGFFWQRSNEITWRQIRRLIGNTEFSRFQLHRAVDPGGSFRNPPRRDRDKFRIDFTDWFPRREDYLERLSRSNVFFGSRRYEGIGLAFLEAMSEGHCVVVPDASTMNEYVVHGQTGFVYDPLHPKAVDFSQADIVAKNAFRLCGEKHRQWREAEGDVIEYISPVTKPLAVSRSLP